MALIKGSVSTRYVGSEYDFEFEIDDEELNCMTDEDIEKHAFEVMCECIDWHWNFVEIEQ